jgi:FixJ family two-component response regulator
MNQPLIFYVDDEPINLSVFETSLPTEWTIRTFSDPLAALERLEHEEPHIVVTDQRMPGITGVRFLELAAKLRPKALRIIVTGYSDEDLVVESVRRAQIFDYIKKPWDSDDLEQSLRRAWQMYQTTEEKERYKNQLEERNKELLQLTERLETSVQRETALRKELESWVPPFLLTMLEKPGLEFPIQRDLVGITFDIIGSAELHFQKIQNRSVQSHIIRLFSEAVLQHGGLRECLPGDSAYGHFGLWESDLNVYQSALTAAQEFRVKLRGFSQIHNVGVECGISLHVARNCTVDIHMAEINSANGKITQKSFGTSSIDVDLLHRMEKIVHNLPGSNIVLSKDFVDNLTSRPVNLKELGSHLLKGQPKPVDMFLIPSDKVTDQNIQQLKEKLERDVKDRSGSKAA